MNDALQGRVEVCGGQRDAIQQLGDCLRSATDAKRSAHLLEASEQDAAGVVPRVEFDAERHVLEAWVWVDLIDEGHPYWHFVMPEEVLGGVSKRKNEALAEMAEDFYEGIASGGLHWLNQLTLVNRDDVKDDELYEGTNWRVARIVVELAFCPEKAD